MSQIGQFTLGGGGGIITTLTGTGGGGPIGPVLGNINIAGAGGITATGAGNTITITGGALGTTNHAVQVGNAGGNLTSIAVGATGTILQGTTGADPAFTATPTVTTMFATTFDTNVVAAAVTLSGTTLSADGTDADININITAKGTGTVVIDELTLTTDLAVTEGGTGVSTFTDHAVLLGSGAAAITAIAVGATGEILVGITGADCGWSSTPTVTTMNATTFDTNVAAAAVTLSGTTLQADGTDVDININITAKGAGTVIIDELTLTTDLAVTEGGTGVSTLTDHGLLVGSGAGAITALGVGAVGTILTGVNAADPTWTTATYPSTLAKGLLMVATAANVIGGLTASTGTAGQILTSGGAATEPAWTTATYPATLTKGDVLCATAANVVGVRAAGTSGQLMTAVTTDIPTWTTATFAGTYAIGTILHASAANTVTGLTAGAVGEILQGNTGAAPSWLAASTDGKVLTAHTGAAPTWETPSSGGLTWSVITANQTAVVDNGYICNKGSALELLLPATSAVGKVIRVTGMNTALGWKITQAANQYIRFASSTTTVGVAGYLQSSAITDSVELVCHEADLGWTVVSSLGNITIV